MAGGAVYQPGVATTVLVAAPGKRFTRARDLRGKTIGVDFLNSIAHIGLLKRWLERGGVSKDDVRITTIPFAQMIGSLTGGQLDAALLPEPFATLALQRGARRDRTAVRRCLRPGVPHDGVDGRQKGRSRPRRAVP